VTDEISALLHDIPDTPAGRQLRWYLAALMSEGEGASLADFARFTPELNARFGPAETNEAMRDFWRRNAAQMGQIVELSIRPRSDLAITAEVATSKERKWTFSLDVEEAPPHRISRTLWERRHEFNLEVREATNADGPILAEIERRCPIVLGDTQFYFDRGADYLASTRLMEDCTIGIASVDGVPAAVSCGAKHVVRVGGTLRPMVTVSHLRVLPEHQRKGLWGAANRILDKYWDNVDGSNAYISVDNAGMQHGFANTANKWGQIILRAQLDCAALAGPPAGRPATPADSEALAERLNAFHGEEEMFVPYSAGSLSARLERAPDLYSWDRVWLTDHAMVGVWPAGDALRVVSQTHGVRSDSVRGVVLDYAFSPGAEDEFEALLRAWCGWLAERGMDRLSIVTSPASPGVEMLKALAREVEPYNMWTPGIAVPDGAAERGLYVDPVYF
jgi:hypothetical protein